MQNGVLRLETTDVSIIDFTPHYIIALVVCVFLFFLNEIIYFKLHRTTGKMGKVFETDNFSNFNI